MSPWPELQVTPGRYACRWFFDKTTCPGEVELQGNRLPTLEIYDDDWAVASDGGITASFGSERGFDRLVGKLRSNHDLVLLEARVEAGFPGWAFGRARLAIAGVGVDGVADDRYEQVLLQLTGADQFFGASPLQHVSFPTRRSRRAPGKFSVEVNPRAEWRWRDRTECLSLTCFYQSRFPLHHYRFELVFAPVVQLVADAELSIGEWITRWIVPLVDVVSLACRQPQHLSWLTVHHQEGDAEVSGVVFGGGIAQDPFEAGSDDEWRRRGQHPMFTLGTLPSPLPVVLRRWRKLSDGANPFVPLYRQVLIRPELPLRAQYLYLIQALEGLHGHKNRETEDRAQKRFGKDRQKLLTRLAEQGAEPAEVKFLRDHWSTRRQIALGGRLKALIDDMPAAMKNSLQQPDMAVIADELRATYESTALHDQMAQLRNELSHGRRNYADHELQLWVDALDVICRAHVMRLLGFEDDAIASSLTTPEPD